MSCIFVGKMYLQVPHGSVRPCDAIWKYREDAAPGESTLTSPQDKRSFLLLERKPRPKKKLTELARSQAKPEPSPTSRPAVFYSAWGGQACGTGQVKSDSKPQPAGGILVSEGMQGPSALPLGTEVLGNSPVPSATTAGLGQDQVWFSSRDSYSSEKGMSIPSAAQLSSPACQQTGCPY